MSKVDDYYVGQRVKLNRKHRTWEVAAHTEGGGLILRTVEVRHPDPTLGGCTYYGKPEIFSPARLDKQLRT